MRMTPALPTSQGFFEVQDYTNICKRALNTVGSLHRQHIVIAKGRAPESPGDLVKAQLPDLTIYVNC